MLRTERELVERSAGREERDAAEAAPEQASDEVGTRWWGKLNDGEQLFANVQRPTLGRRSACRWCASSTMACSLTAPSPTGAPECHWPAVLVTLTRGRWGYRAEVEGRGGRPSLRHPGKSAITDRVGVGQQNVQELCADYAALSI